VAGENMCRSANLMTDNEGSATGGFGAVMGSKNLKALAVLGTGSPLVAKPEELKELNQLPKTMRSFGFTFLMAQNGIFSVPLR
jgi:aldehyde:ferredoxin oxidoreductase